MTSILEQELAPLSAQIEQIRAKREMLKEQLGVVAAELEQYSAARQRFDALRNVCDALDKLDELEAGRLFWKGISGEGDAARHLQRIQSRLERFEQNISEIKRKRTRLETQIDRRNKELAFLYEEVQETYEREERRREEFVIEREISPVPYRAMIMPWTKHADSERGFRRAVLMAMLICLIFGYFIPKVNVPLPEYTETVVEIPERLAKLVKKEPFRPSPAPKPVPKEPEEKPQEVKDESKPEPEKKKPDKKLKKKAPAPKPPQVAKKSGGKSSAARKKAERVGVLAFKDTFKDLMDETPVAKLGTEARISRASPKVKGQATAQRSLVAMQAPSGSSGGISNFGISRNLGNGNGGRLGGSGIGKGSGGGNGSGAGFTKVESSIANLEESSRPLSDGPGPGRTDEEIQIVFDRYKAALYRIYNRELRKDPTLRGKILLKISIETSGVVSLCKVESTDLKSPELVAKIVARIKRFNFGPKEGVAKITILYPIDFLPAA
jgi:outer membrane biosynthesis protein TonB/prefoldin subunit 5